MSTDLLYHHSILLNDAVRMQAYTQALQQVVKPGAVVLDIGCGLGVLSFLAAKLGAQKVYAIEYDKATLQLAKQLAKKNQLAEKIKFLLGMSTRLKLPEKVDVIVAEIFGNCAINENILPVLHDAKKRFLKKGGIIIPQNCLVTVVPVDFTKWGQSLQQMNQIAGLKFVDTDLNYDVQLRSESIEAKYFLAEPQKLCEINFLQTVPNRIQQTLSYHVQRGGTLNGFAAWFHTQLTADIAFATSPKDAATHWQQAFFPLQENLSVEEGDKIVFYFESEPDSLPAGPNNIISYGYVIK